MPRTTDKHPTTGKFTSGNIAAEGRAQPGTDIPCPPGLAARGLVGVWVELVKQSKSGNYQATAKLLDLSEKHGGDPITGKADAVDHRYDGIPDETAALLRELDVGIADTVHRWQIGLPCADIEVLIAETALAVRAGGPKAGAVTRWRQVTIEAIQKLRQQEQKGSHDEQRKPTATTRPRGSSQTPDGPAVQPGHSGRTSARPGTTPDDSTARRRPGSDTKAHAPPDDART